MDTFGKVLAAFSFIALILLLPAFIWHIRSRNIPASTLIFWIMFKNLFTFINACIWSEETFIEAWDGKGYCDVFTKIDSGSSVAKVSCISSLTFDLYMILSAENSIFLEKNSKRRVIINLLMCWITPIFVIATSYLIQKYRYIIVRYGGCVTPYEHSYVSLILHFVWILLWGIIGLIFAILTILKYLQKRRDVKDILRCTNSGLTFKRFARLLIFSILVILVLFPLSVYFFVADVSSKTQESYSFSAVHGPDWNNILYSDFGTSYVYYAWIDLALSIITFILFGLGSDAIAMYKSALYKIGFKSLKDNSPSQAHTTKSLSSQFDQSRTSTNQSHSTSKSFPATKTTTEGSTIVNENHNRMVDFGDYNDLISENDVVLESPYSLSSKDPARVSTQEIDLERDSFKQADHPIENDTVVEYGGPVRHSHEGFDYNLKVIENKP